MRRKLIRLSLTSHTKETVDLDRLERWLHDLPDRNGLPLRASNGPKHCAQAPVLSDNPGNPKDWGRRIPGPKIHDLLYGSNSALGY